MVNKGLLGITMMCWMLSQRRESWAIAIDEIAKLNLKLTPEQTEELAAGEPQNTEPSGPRKK